MRWLRRIRRLEARVAFLEAQLDDLMKVEAIIARAQRRANGDHLHLVDDT
jgi:hypothetical protein